MIQFVESQPLNLYAGTTLDGAAILTSADTLSPAWSNIINRPSGLDDGDDDTQLSAEQVRTYAQAAALNLHAGTTLGGQTIQVGTEQDSLAALSCSDGEILVYDAGTSTWACGEDANSQRSDAEIVAAAEASSSLTLSLHSDSTLGGEAILSENSPLPWANLSGVPSEIADGDHDTLAGLSCAVGEVAVKQSGAWGCAPFSTDPLDRPYSEDCLDFGAVGFSSREACLRDGRWHRFGSYQGGVAIPDTEYNLLHSLIGSGADVRLTVPNGGVTTRVNIERIILNCSDSNRMCFYALREYGSGFATFGMNVTNSAGPSNGYYWIGDERNIATLNDYYDGTGSDLGAGTTNYEVSINAGAWHEIVSSGANVSLDSATFQKIRTLAYRGAEFKIRSRSTNHDLIHRVVRVIPDCGASCMWFYLWREDDDNGIKSFGMNVDETTNNGNYWIGDPIDITGFSQFFTGTSGGIATGTFEYTLYAKE